ncbi:MAG: hypothetical protein HRF46_14110 [Acidobacteriota bacterium]
MASSKSVTWKDLEVAAEEVFRVLGGAEMSWARQIWELLAGLGLAAAPDELARHRVAIRFLALARVHHDFCYHAWKKDVEPRLAEWAYYLELQPLRVGQLLGPEVPLTGANTEAEALEEALEELTRRERPVLFEGLVRALGNPSKVFVAFWRSREAAHGGGNGNGRESDEAILNDLSFEKIDAFEFVSKGFPPRQRRKAPAKRASLDLAELGIKL